MNIINKILGSPNIPIKELESQSVIPSVDYNISPEDVIQMVKRYMIFYPPSSQHQMHLSKRASTSQDMRKQNW